MLGIDIEGMMEFEFIDYLYICDTHKNSKLYRLKSHPCNKLNTPTSHFLSIIKTKVYKIFFSPIQIRENVFCVYLRRQGLMFADVAVFFLYAGVADIENIRGMLVGKHEWNCIFFFYF